jgi:Spy/CpxP family protein refolding chaperone
MGNESRGGADVTKRFGLVGISILLVMSLSSVVAAQGTDPGPVSDPAPAPGAGPGPHATPDQRADHQLQQMTAELGLTAEQQVKLRPILLERAQKADALRKGSAPRGRAQRQEMRTLAESYTERIDAILTPEQQAKAEQIRAEARAKARGERQRRGAGAAPAEPPAPTEPPK